MYEVVYYSFGYKTKKRQKINVLIINVIGLLAILSNKDDLFMPSIV